MERKIRVERPANCRFDERKAERAVRFFNERLVHTKGRWAGQPFQLRPWQEVDIREIFGRVNEDGARTVRQVVKFIPKKNGKSEEAAGIALKLLFADAEPGAEIYGCAADRDQASIVFAVAASMVRHNRHLNKLAKVIDSTKRIVIPGWESFYRAISAEVGGKHGFNSHGVIFDELHTQRDSRLWEVTTFGSGAARSQPLIFGISTAGLPGESPVAEMLWEEADQILRGIVPCPGSFYPVIYAAPENADWNDEEVWRACNPAMGDFLAVESVREEYDRARRRPSEQNSFRRLRLNQWVSQQTRFIDMADWDRCSGAVDFRELRHLPCYVGIDLSTKLDVTALVFVFLDGCDTFHCAPYFFLPKDNMADRPNQEVEKYRQWSRDGYLRLTEGNVVDYQTVRKVLNEVRQTYDLDIRQIGFDPWNATHLAQDLMEDGYTPVEVRQGYRTLSEPTKELQSAIIQGNFRHGGHPVLRWMADCVSVRQDENGNIKPVKPNRLKSSKRIDGIVALVMAMSRMIVHKEQRSAWSGSTVVI